MLFIKTLMQMLLVLSKTVKVTYVDIVEKLLAIYFRTVASISPFPRYALSLTCIRRIV